MIDVASTGIGRASEIVTANIGEGNKVYDWRSSKNVGITDFGSFFESKMNQFTENMEQAAENQSNGQSHRRG